MVVAEIENHGMQVAYFVRCTEGLRSLDVSNVANETFKEAGFFDTHPLSAATQINGACTAFPYFASGNVIIGDMRGGLFIVRPQPATLGLGQTTSSLRSSAR